MSTLTHAPNLTELAAEVIAESRFLAWDSHAQGANAMTWREFKADDPQIAHGIYLEDGRRDAKALMPLVESVFQGAQAGALTAAANALDGKPGDEAPSPEQSAIADWLRRIAAGILTKEGAPA